MAPVLGDFQLQFGDDGVLMNGDVSGTSPFIDVESVSGLDSAEYRTSNKDIEGQDGSVIEAEFESKRTITITGTIYAGTHTQMESYVDLLKANFAVSKTAKPLYFKAPGVAQRMAYGKCTSGFRCNWDPMRRVAKAAFSVTLSCGDTIIYGVDELMWPGSVTFSNAPGFTFNFSFSFDFGAIEGGVVGQMQASHGGNRPAPFTALFTGNGAVNPGILHEDLGLTVQTNLTLNPGDELSIDFLKRKVLFNGSPRRGSVIREGWFMLQPYVVNNLRLLTNSGSLSVTLSGHDAWR